jgi:tRNA 2-selenouridine synthase
VPVEKVLISDLLSAAPPLVFDVRSPAEFKQARLPGAVSLPLFTDDERKIIGTAYKQQSREVAVRLGLDFFSPRMKHLIDEAEAIMKEHGLRKTEPVYVYCWRGGMRSGSVAWLLDLYGFKVRVLAGGYKSFRRKGLEILDRDVSLNIIGGYTGSGKTEILAELKNQGQPVIDLEAVAGHKGSAFGNLYREQQPSQEMFENLLALELERCANEFPGQSIWLEDESQRIGAVNIPNVIWEKMRRSLVHFLEIPFEERLSHILPEYGAYDKQLLIEAVERIAKRLGGLETKNAIQLLETGDVRGAFSILLHYYDKKYYKSLHNRDNLNLQVVPCNTVSAANAVKLNSPALST